MIDTSKQHTTKDGQEVTQLVKFDITKENYSIAGVVDGELELWTDDGFFFSAGEVHVHDLIEVKNEQWHYIYQSLGFISVSAIHFESEVLAKYDGLKYKKDNYIGTWKLPQ